MFFFACNFSYHNINSIQSWTSSNKMLIIDGVEKINVYFTEKKISLSQRMMANGEHNGQKRKKK